MYKKFGDDGSITIFTVNLEVKKFTIDIKKENTNNIYVVRLCILKRKKVVLFSENRTISI